MKNPETIWQISKSIVLFGVLVIFIVLCYKALNRWNDHFDLKDSIYQEQMILISKNIVSQQVNINTEELENKIKSLNESIVDMVKERDQQINDIGETIAKMDQSIKEASSSYYHDEDSSKDYDEVVITNSGITSEDGTELPVAWAMYSPNIDSEDKWTIGTYPLEIHENIILAENEDRLDVIVEAWAETDILTTTKDKKFPITIEKVSWTRREPTNSWMFNMRPSINFGISKTIYPSLSLSFFSYGKSDRDMNWRFLGIGIGRIDDDLSLHFTPVEYNLGNNLPLIENLFGGLQYNVQTDSSNLGLVFGVPF